MRSTEGGGDWCRKRGGGRRGERGRGVYCSSTRKGTILVFCDHLYVTCKKRSALRYGTLHG